MVRAKVAARQHRQDLGPLEEGGLGSTRRTWLGAGRLACVGSTEVLGECKQLGDVTVRGPACAQPVRVLVDRGEDQQQLRRQEVSGAEVVVHGVQRRHESALVGGDESLNLIVVERVPDSPTTQPRA